MSIKHPNPSFSSFLLLFQNILNPSFIVRFNEEKNIFPKSLPYHISIFVQICKTCESEEKAAKQLHAAAPRTKRGLRGRHVILGVTILNDDDLRLRLHDHRLLVIRPTSVCVHRDDLLLHVGLVVSRSVVVVHYEFIKIIIKSPMKERNSLFRDIERFHSAS